MATPNNAKWCGSRCGQSFVDVNTTVATAAGSRRQSVMSGERNAAPPEHDDRDEEAPRIGPNAAEKAEAEALGISTGPVDDATHAKRAEFGAAM